jgi:hypothetical protein
MAGNVYECDRCVRKHEISLREAAKYMKEVSQIDAERLGFTETCDCTRVYMLP